MVGERVAEVLTTRGGEFGHGFTYSGHPAACAAGLAVYLGALALLFPVGRHLWRHVPSGRHPSE